MTKRKKEVEPEIGVLRPPTPSALNCVFTLEQIRAHSPESAQKNAIEALQKNLHVSEEESFEASGKVAYPWPKITSDRVHLRFETVRDIRCAVFFVGLDS